MKWTPAPLMLALDLDDEAKAWQIAQDLQGRVSAIKVGPRLIQKTGDRLVKDLAKLAPVFVDCKYHDIPSTMEAAVRASFAAGATFVTVHASAGPEALQRMAKVEAELNQKREFHLLAVTVLTSFSDDEKSLPANWKKQAVREHVLQLATQVKAAGLTGLVCSPEELLILRDLGLNLITPGIRLPGAESHDQRRVTGPAEAKGFGAWAMVVGRPILEAPDPRQAAEQFLQAWQQA